MRVREVMTSEVQSCTQGDSLYVAARIMWEYDCGCVPIVSEESRVAGMLTDRDICMAAFIQKKSLEEMSVASALRDDPVSHEVWSCGPDDSLEEAEAIMREYKVRRLPVVDPGRRLLGILSIDDLARQTAGETRPRKRRVLVNGIGETLVAICEPDAESETVTSLP